ncbi:hypothetical protein MMUR_00640 [Mycolicibacterium murale]|uniref:TraA/ATP-dependent exoDNAse/relaxase n=1 Tax=Mycolicibacterium murale TaxID=182220 RepID=A0A7I9WF26_9MYCO|nr:AAA family ATPase [Mycolicibacterium murale]GFG55928.1 hypothetical protein MMUR_00640 [Mycolicibacterium murale]
MRPETRSGGRSTGRAVDVAVREEAGDHGATLDALLGQLERGTEVLDTDTVIVVDEAGMVGTQHLRRLLETATAAGTKVVLVGDEHQLAPVAQRGGTFAQLVTDLPWAQRLSQVWRMHDHDERDASLAVRDGGPAALRRAVGWYRRHDRLHIGDVVTMADDVLAAWTADIAAGRDALLIADRWEMADALNMRIHAERIGDDAPTVATARGHRVAAGDVVITRQNTIDITAYTDNTLATAADPIRNGQRWEVLAVDPETNRIGVRRLDECHRRPIGRLPPAHAFGVRGDRARRPGRHRRHLPRPALGRGRDPLDRHVGLTRGRHTNTVRLYDTEPEADHEHADPAAAGVHRATRAPGAGRDRAAQRPGPRRPCRHHHRRRRGRRGRTSRPGGRPAPPPPHQTARLRRERRIDRHDAHDQRA